VASVAFLFTVVMVVGKTGTPKAGQWLFIVMSGVLDALGNLLFSTAAHLGRLDVSAVLSSLYPAATVLLAWLFLREKLRRRQWMGVGIAFVALGLISI
jgi:uncharacterized membrane protein